MMIPFLWLVMLVYSSRSFENEKKKKKKKIRTKIAIFA